MNKTALITGASGGIGEDLARVFAAEGHDLVLVARSRDKLAALATELSSRHGVRAKIIPADLSKAAEPERIVAELKREGIEVFFLVNNAGVGITGPFATNEIERELGMLQLNIVALVHLTRLLLPDMLARGAGRVLNVGSTAGFQPGPNMASYYATKAYVNTFSVALSHELKKTSVSATVLCPGATHTGFADLAGNANTQLFSGPFSRFTVMKSADVARIGYRAMQKGRPLVVAGLFNKMLAFSVRLTPRWLVTAIAARMNA